MGRKLDFLNMDTLLAVLPAVMTVLHQLKDNSGRGSSRSSRRSNRSAERANKVKSAEPQKNLDAIMQLLPTLATVLPALKATASGSDDADMERVIDNLQNVLSESKLSSGEVSAKLTEILPDVLKVLSQLSKLNLGPQKAELDQVSELLAEMAGPDQQSE